MTEIDWRTDWLYSLIFKEVDRIWEHSCRDRGDSKYHQYVLVQEGSSMGGARPSGRLRRAWVRDDNGLKEISLEEHKAHERKIHGRIYPYVIVMFSIYPDRQRIVLGRQDANTAGIGRGYLVEGEGETAKLIPDPNGVAWRS